MKDEFSELMQNLCHEFKKSLVSTQEKSSDANEKIITELDKLKEDNYMIYKAVTSFLLIKNLG